VKRVRSCAGVSLSSTTAYQRTTLRVYNVNSRCAERGSVAVTDADPPEVAPDLDAVGLRVLSDVALLLLGEDIATHLADLAAARDGVEEQDRTPSACEPGPRAR
jgi:hypothetical protein